MAWRWMWMRTAVCSGADGFSQVFWYSCDFPYVTPTGAFTKDYGGGFLVWFDADYQPEWALPYGSQCTNCGVYDAKIWSTGPLRFAEVTGTAATTSGAYIYSLDVTAPNNWTGFYQPQPGGGWSDAYYAELDLQSHENRFCTFWGGNGDDSGIACEVFGKQVWVGGGTSSTDLGGGHLPGAGGIHDATFGGAMDACILQFGIVETYPTLQWGSLYGGADHDIILDLEACDRLPNRAG